QEVCARSGGALARRQSGSARVVSGKSVCERAAAGNSLRAVAILVYDFRGKAAVRRLVETKIAGAVRADARTRSERALRCAANSRAHRAPEPRLKSAQRRAQHSLIRCLRPSLLGLRCLLSPRGLNYPSLHGFERRSGGCFA